MLDSISVALTKANFPEGTKIKLTKLVQGVPENTVGVIDFVDDAGMIFIETPGNLPNFSFNKRDFGKSFVLA
ncbi:MAG: DUF4314 domain-containing protein [Acutalibacteraceae bacterium]|nr:DUF4314 domain-containing protein [Acutalibacteraceae bacterium]